MTNDELHDLIKSNPAAVELADAGNDSGCAALLEVPAIIVPCLVGELGVIAAFADPAAGEACLQKLESVASENPLVARILKWMQPGAPGIDMGDDRTRTMLDALVGAGKFTQEEADAVKRLAERPQAVAADEVSAAWKRYRLEVPDNTRK